jgi:glycosyltransferase involved in cell wall biosynthesis
VIEVVIPAHNAAPFLRAALESVAAQTHPPARVTVVNDRSTDGTRALAEACARNLAPRLDIRVLDNAGPPGPAAARNTAIRASTAPWIALLDADDLLEPAHHATLGAIAEGAPGTALAFGDCSLFDGETGAVLVESHHAKSGLVALASEAAPGGGRRLASPAFEALLDDPHVPTSASLLRREALLRHGLFDETMLYCEDAHLFLRLAAAEGVVFTPARLARKRMHDANLSHDRNDLPFRRSEALCVMKLLGLAPGEGAGIVLTPAQRAAALAALPRLLNGYLYEASRHGPRAYADGVALCRAAGLGRLAWRPRHLARALVRGFSRGP